MIHGQLLKPSETAFKLKMTTELKGIIIPVSLKLIFIGPLKLIRNESCGKLFPSPSLIPPSRILDLSGIVQVDYEALDGFAKFACDLVNGDKVDLDLIGDGVRLEVFGINIDNLYLKKSISIKGMEGLKETRVDRVDVVGGTREYMVLEVYTTIINSSNMDLVSLGDVRLAMFYKFKNLAELVMEDLTLVNGENKYIITVHFSIPEGDGVSGASIEGDDRSVAIEALSNFCSGIPSDITISGASKPTPIPFLSPSLKSLSISTILPGLPTTLLKRSVLLVSSPLSLLTLKVPNKLLIENSFGTRLTILKMSGFVYHKGDLIATLDQDLSSFGGILIPSHTTLWTPPVWLRLQVGMGVLRVGSELVVDVETVLDVKVGEYFVREVGYKQNGVELGIGFS